MKHISSKLFYILVATAVLVLFSVISAGAAVDKNTVAVWLFEEGSGKNRKRCFWKWARWRIYR